MTRQQVFYIRGIELRKIGDEVKSSSDKVIDYLTEQGHDFIHLGHQSVSNTRGEASSRDVLSLVSKKVSALYCGLNCASSERMVEHSIPTRNEP